MKLRFLLFIAAIMLMTLFSFAQSHPLQELGSLDPSDLEKLSTVLSRAEPRQMGIFGFAALGAMMFPILVSLGMASFVSHLPTVFKEFATEFGIPSTPPRNFFMFRRKRSDVGVHYEDRWQNFLEASHSNLMKELEKRNVYL